MGLLNGALFVWIFRKRSIFFQLLGSWAISFAAAYYFLWYAKGYDGFGLWSLWLAYGMTGLMVAEIIALPLPFILALVSIPKNGKLWVQRLSLAAILAAVGIGVYGSVDGNTSERVEHYDLYVDNLPASFEGYKIAQVTDTHIGPYFRYSDLPAEIERAHVEGADILAFTGDLIDDVRYMPDAAKALSEGYKDFPDGILYVWGNHEYYRGKDYIEQELDTTPVHRIVNSHEAIRRGSDVLYFTGVDYPWAKGSAMKEEMKEMADEAWDGVPEGSNVIFLAHHSAFIDEGLKRGAIITLTGHTHGTQFGLFGKPIITPFTYTRGMYSDGIHKGYVSVGTGSWFPFRWSCERELTVFTLKRA